MKLFAFPLGRYDDDGVRPARAQRERVQAALQGETDVHAAWHKLQRLALLPRPHEGWPARSFRHISPQPIAADSHEKSRSITNSDGGPPAVQRWFETDRSEPFSVEDAELWASDSAGIEQAEAAAWTLCERLRIFDQALPRRLVWRVMSAAETTWRVGGHKRLDDVDVFVVEAFDRAAHIRPTDPQTKQYLLGDALWELGAAHGHRFPAQVDDPYCIFAEGPPRVPQAIVGKRMRDLPNPFAPLTSLRRLGYRLDMLNDDELVILAPPR